MEAHVRAQPPRTVMTVLGPIDARELGPTDAHEHLFLRSPALPGDELDDVDKALQEVREAEQSGLRAFVELTPIGLGRRPDLLRQIAQQSGAHVVAATGYHRDAHYSADHWVMTAGEDLLAERMAADIELGMHRADWSGEALAVDEARAGVIKVGGSYQRISVPERRRLVAAAAVSSRTGVAIVAHTEVGTCGDEIADTLVAGGVSPGRIVLAHMDRNPDAELHLELLARGLSLVYDTPGRIKYHPDSTLLDLVARVCEAGYGGQVLLGLDLGRRDYFRSYGGGPGLRYLMDVFVPRLRRRIGEAAVDAILVANPARAFSIA